MYKFNFEKLDVWKKAKMYAYSSLMENINQLIISNELEYVNDEDIRLLRKEANIISYMLNNLRLAVDNKKSDTT